MSKLAKEFEAAVEKAGFTPAGKARHKRHRTGQYTHRDTGDAVYTIVLPSSPSDQMGLVNFRCYLRRLARRGPAPYGSRRG